VVVAVIAIFAMAGEEGEGVATATAVPKATIYVHNLDEKTPKSTLKKSLYSVFSQFGKIEGVIARRCALAAHAPTSRLSSHRPASLVPQGLQA
jgi:RNA recognition motif-containing protein